MRLILSSDFPIDWLLIATIVVMLAASGFVWTQLVRRATTKARRETLRRWARLAGFKLVGAVLPDPPAPLNELHVFDRQVDDLLVSKDVTLVRFRTRRDASDADWQVWHVAITSIPDDRPAVGLRPSGATRSAIDLFGLPQSPITRESHRFHVLGDDVLAARRVIDGHTRGLLPGDLGLLQIRKTLLIDFSARHFDPIELSRMVALLQQIVRVG